MSTTIAGLRWAIISVRYRLDLAVKVLPEVGGPHSPAHLYMSDVLAKRASADRTNPASTAEAVATLSDLRCALSTCADELLSAAASLDAQPSGIEPPAAGAAGNPHALLAPPQILDASLLVARWAREHELENFSVNGIGPTLLLKAALRFFQHADGCSMREWSDPADHVSTWFGFTITAPECSCGAIALACQLDAAAARRVEE